MAPNTEGDVLSRVEFVLPKNVLHTAFHLARGIGATFLSTNLQRKTATHIKLFKKQDESVLINCTVTRLKAGQLHRPEHVLIDQVKGKPEASPGPVAGLPEAPPAAPESTIPAEGCILTPPPRPDAGCEPRSRAELVSPVVAVVSETQERVPDSLLALDDAASPEKRVASPEAQRASPRRSPAPKPLRAGDKASSAAKRPRTAVVQGTAAEPTVSSTSNDVREITEARDNTKESMEQDKDSADKSGAQTAQDSRREKRKRRSTDARGHGSKEEKEPHDLTAATESPRRSGRATHLPARLAESEVFPDRTRTASQKLDVDEELRPDNSAGTDGARVPRDQEAESPDGASAAAQKRRKINTDSEDSSTFRRKHAKAEKTTPCPLCRALLRSYEKVYDHVKKQHATHAQCARHLAELKKKMKTKCDICGREIAKPSALKAHVDAMHTERSEATCSTCGAVLKSERHLQLHVKRCHLTTNRSHLCHLCPAGFKVKQYLVTHLQNVHVDAGDAAFACDVCPKTFSTERYMKTHKLRVHGPKKYACTQCDMSFSEPPNLRRHVRLVHDAPRTKRFFCPTCHKGFSMKSNLKEHVQTIHLRRFPLRCGVCGDGFSRRRALEAHRQEAHRPGARKREVAGSFIALGGDGGAQVIAVSGDQFAVLEGGGGSTLHGIQVVPQTAQLLPPGGGEILQTVEVEEGVALPPGLETLAAVQGVESVGASQTVVDAEQVVIPTTSGGELYAQSGNAFPQTSVVVAHAPETPSPPDDDAVQTVCIVATPEMLEAFGIQDDR